MSPLQYTHEQWDEFKGKMITIVLSEPIQIKNKEIESKNITGYFHNIGCSATPPHLPVFVNFIHESISDNVNEMVPDKFTTCVNVFNMESIQMESNMKLFILELKNNLSKYSCSVNKDSTIDEIQLGDYMSSNCTFKTSKKSTEVTVTLSIRNGSQYEPDDEFTFSFNSSEGKSILNLFKEVKNHVLNSSPTGIGDSETKIANSEKLIYKYFK